MFSVNLRRLTGATLAAAFAVTALTGTVLAGGPPALKNGADVQKANLLVANNCLSSDVSTTTTVVS